MTLNTKSTWTHFVCLWVHYLGCILNSASSRLLTTPSSMSWLAPRYSKKFLLTHKSVAVAGCREFSNRTGCQRFIRYFLLSPSQHCYIHVGVQTFVLVAGFGGMPAKASILGQEWLSIKSMVSLRKSRRRGKRGGINPIYKVLIVMWTHIHAVGYACMNVPPTVVGMEGIWPLWRCTGQ